MAISLSLVAIGLAFYIGGGGGGGGSELDGASSAGPAPGTSQASSDAYRLCRYEGAPPSPENRVRVAGGATCAEAAILFNGGPAFQDLKRHRFNDVVLKPKASDGWMCRARQPGGEYTGLHLRCWDGQQRVRFVFF